jgi:tripartite-type tricarboxylate transporter receptor subunit TctC
VNRRELLHRTLALAALGSPLAGRADTWPSRPVTFINPAGTGGPSDLLGRPLAERLRQKFGQPFLIDSRAGGGGNIGTGAVAQAKPDGYTLLVTSNTPIVVNPALYGKLPYDPIADLLPLAMLGDGGNVALVVPADSPAKTLAQLVERRRKTSDPGNYVSSGVGFPGHITSELFRQRAGFPAQHIPMRGAGAAMQELMSGRVDFYFAPVTTAMPAAASGRVRILAVPAAKRDAFLPDVPTFAEQGLPDVTLPPLWVCAFAPTGTPAAIVEPLGEEMRRTTELLDYRQLQARLGFVPSDLGLKELGARVRSDYAMWTRVVKELGIKPE